MRMTVTIWAALLFAVGSIRANPVTVPEKASNLNAEAGLCVVIPCRISSDLGQSAVWYKCEQKCDNAVTIIDLNNTNPNARSGFRGRVSLLEPDVSQRNCSIIINDLTESDSGSYHLSETQRTNTVHTATITVKDLTQKPTVTVPALTAGQQTTLTCTAPGLCSGSEPKITWTWRGAGESHSHITGNITAFKTENVTAVTQRHSSTLTFNPSAEHHGTNVTCKVSFTNNITTEETVTLSVTYVKESKVTGNTTVKEGDTLNLTCSVESFPPSHVSWTSSKNLHNGTESDQQKNPGTATLVIPNVKAEHTGQYICESKQLNMTKTMFTNVTVTSAAAAYPKILSTSGCMYQLDVQTCSCISQGFPLPNITWQLLESHTEISVISMASNHTVVSTITLAVKGQSSTTVDCVSRNENGEVKLNLVKNKVAQKEEGSYLRIFNILKQPEVIIGFLIGAFLSAIICCLVRKCHRKKQTYANLAETLEMVASHKDSQANANQAVEDEQAVYQETAEADVEYSDLDFNHMKAESSAEAGATKGAPETEYAEIKKEKAAKSEVGEGKDEDGMIGEEKEKTHAPDEEEDEEVALYATVNDVVV